MHETSRIGRRRVTAHDRLDPSQQQAWLSYMRVYHRMEYEMNRQLQSDAV